jgi:hypothetical protein
MSSAWADMFCPNNFNSINIGDSLDAVIAACGAPDSKKESKKTPFQPQEWTYYIQQPALGAGMVGTLKTTFAFDASGKMVNMSVNGAGESQSMICDNITTLSLGDTTDKVEKVCGKPVTITQTNTAMGAPKPTEVTELLYNGTPSVTLVFEDGILKERR